MFLWYRPGGRLTPDEIADGYADLLLKGCLCASRRGWPARTDPFIRGRSIFSLTWLSFDG